MEESSEMQTASRSQAWFCTTGLASDVLVEVGDVIFHLHKFPLMYRSRRVCELITDQEEAEKEEESEEGEGEIREEKEEDGVVERRRISLPGFPGGSGAFEAAAKFCYGVKIEFTASNVVPIRCAAEYLQMTDDVSENNLVGRSERFFANTVLRSVRYSVRALMACDGDLLDMADELGITERCVDSIAAAQTLGSGDRSGLLGWPINDGAGGGTRGGRMKGASSRSSSAAATAVLSDSWIEQLAALSLPVFKRVISAMKARDLSSDLIEGSLISYARRSIPGLSRSSKKKSSGSSVPSEQDQRELIETVVTNLPVEKSSSSSTNTKFLFGLLRTVNILRAADSAREILEKKIGSQLEQSTLDDLLMPTYFYLVETLYDVDCVERLLLYFLDGLRQRDAAEGDGEDGGGDGRSALLAVGKIIDGYLSEIGSDINLQPEKFCRLAFTLPDQARVFDDGLYRAVDVYLKAHPGISETERENIAGIMDCQKLTLEACTHAAQNERLPLRAVVQVLFFEQLQLRHAITGSFVPGEQQHGTEEEDDSGGRGRGWGPGVRNSQVMRLDMDSMRNRMEELEKECSTMKKAIEKIDRTGRSGGVCRKGSLSKKIGCKFRTQVCDSQERNIIEITDGRSRRTEL